MNREKRPNFTRQFRLVLTLAACFGLTLTFVQMPARADLPCQCVPVLTNYYCDQSFSEQCGYTFYGCDGTVHQGCVSEFSTTQTGPCKLVPPVLTRCRSTT